ncbi:MAG: hypothetical protein ABIG44_18465 [Planctomycetota bacterium]
MYRSRLLPFTMLLGFSVLLSGGCPVNLGELLGLNVITLEIINDTDYDIDPYIVFDDDSDFLAGWFPSEELSTGVLAPGEVLTYTFDCDQLGLVQADEPEQYVGFFVYTADSTSTIAQGDEYECGDLVQFQFLGNADSFGVLVAVNGVVVD